MPLDFIFLSVLHTVIFLLYYLFLITIIIYPFYYFLSYHQPRIALLIEGGENVKLNS